MDDNLTLGKSLDQVMETLPKPIREYIADGNVDVVVEKLTKKYSLHIDQSGVLERELMLVLMGVESADEFTNALKTDVGIPEDLAGAMLADLNQDVFIPIQNKMREADQKAPPTAVPKTGIPVPRYGQLQHPQFSNKPSLQNAPQSAKMPVQPPKMLGMPQAQASKIMPDHMLPVGEGAPVLPAQKTQPPPNLPGVISSAQPMVPPVSKPSAPLSASEIANRPPVPPPIASKPIPPVPKPLSKLYGVDPYREPIDES